MYTSFPRGNEKNTLFTFQSRREWVLVLEKFPRLYKRWPPLHCPSPRSQSPWSGEPLEGRESFFKIKKNKNEKKIWKLLHLQCNTVIFIVTQSCWPVNLHNSVHCNDELFRAFCKNIIKNEKMSWHTDPFSFYQFSFYQFSFWQFSLISQSCTLQYIILSHEIDNFFDFLFSHHN